MSEYGLDEVLANLRQELTAAEIRATETTSRFKTLWRVSESLKIDVLQSYLEERRKSQARDKGIASLIKDRKKFRDSLLLAAGSFVLGGLLTRDKFGAITAGMSGFDGMVQGLGESKWYVILGKKISVIPEETISPKVMVIAFDSFDKMTEELKKKALAGEKLGNLDDVISLLEKNPRLTQQ
jgi:hypothetical protein